MTTDERTASFRASLLASANDDAPRKDAADRELARLGLSSAAALGATTTSASAAPLAKTAAGGAVAKTTLVTALASTTAGKVCVLTIAALATAGGSWIALREPSSAQPPEEHRATRAPHVLGSSTRQDTPASASAKMVPIESAQPIVLADPPPSVPIASVKPVVLAEPPSVPIAPPSPIAVAEPPPPSTPSVDRAAPAAAENRAGPPQVVPRAEAGAPRATLAQEIALVDRARSLTSSAPNEALAALDEHARTFPNGVLHDEAAVARVEALIAIGRRAEALRFAQPIRRDRPGTPLARRLEMLLGSAASP